MDLSFKLIATANEFCTPESAGLTMYYSITPRKYCHRTLPIPRADWRLSTARFGPFEHRPAGAFQKFTIHRSPLEQLVARWRTGDIRELVRRIGTPTPGMSAEQERSLLAERSEADRTALDNFRDLVFEEFEVGEYMGIVGHLQLAEGAELFSQLVCAASFSLDREVHLFQKSWRQLEEKHAERPESAIAVTVGSAFSTLTSALKSVFGRLRKHDTPDSVASARSATWQPSAVSASQDVNQELATPAFRSSAISALAHLALGQRTV